ncbi:MAG TPA: 2-dehydropantoate 2-reductase [Candidatus Binatia bacterium]|nr:2-dehydropantoate 2-reductase [Candidatus Binatia bacterium]
MTDLCIYGAGSIGGYVGGRLAAGGSRVHFVARPRIASELRAHGLHLTDYRGADLRVPAAQVQVDTKPEGAREASLVLVTVKSAATADAARELARVLPPRAVVISFQNGLHNAEVLREFLPGRTVLTGMVPFNVVHRGEGRFHQGSQGELEVERHAALPPFLPAFAAAGLPLLQHADMPAVLWGKLLLNLNNCINALSGLPLRDELSQRAFRRCLALAQRELLELLAQAGIRPAQLTALPPRWLPRMLSVPDFLFRRLANRMLAIDPLARSSMWEDLEAGRKTEIDWLNGEVVRLAQKIGRPAPVNGRLIALVRKAETGGRRDWSGVELLRELRQAAG